MCEYTKKVFTLRGKAPVYPKGKYFTSQGNKRSKGNSQLSSLTRREMHKNGRV